MFGEQDRDGYLRRLAELRAVVPPEEEGFVYLSGPYRPKDGRHNHSAYFEIDGNISRAREWSIKLASWGLPFFCPHQNSAHAEVLAPEVPPAYWLHIDLAILARAEAVLLLPGWRISQGSLEEKRFAEQQEIPVFKVNVFGLLLRFWLERLESVREEIAAL